MKKTKRDYLKKTKTNKEGDDDDLVHTDNDQDTNIEESEGKDQRKERTKII